MGCLGEKEGKTRSLKTGWSASAILMCWNKSDMEDSHQSQEPEEVFFKGKCSMKYEFHGCWLLLHSIRIKDHVHDAQIKVSESVFMIPHSIWPTVTLYGCSTENSHKNQKVMGLNLNMIFWRFWIQNYLQHLQWFQRLPCGCCHVSQSIICT